MQGSKLLVAILGGLSTMPAFAEEGKAAEEAKSPLSGEVRLVSDYLYRGISQTGTNPAIQASVAYEHSSGVYAELELSSSSFFKDLNKETGGVEGASSASLEYDISLGFRNEFADEFHYDVGYLSYNFPGTYPAEATKGDTGEVYGALGYKWLTAKYSYSLGDTFGIKKAKGSSYIELNADIPVAEGMKVEAHVGQQNFSGTAADALKAEGRTPVYSDYRLGVTKELAGFELGLAYSKTNAPTGAGTFYNVLGKDLGKGTVVASVSRSF